MRRFLTIRMLLAALLAGLLCSAASAQTAVQGTGTINATLVNLNGIAVIFNSDTSGVALGSSGTSAATMNFGTVSAAGPLSPGVTLTSLTSTKFTVSSPFYIFVVGGANSTSYTLTAQLPAAAPTGISYGLDTLTLSTARQTVTAQGTYNTNVLHSLNLAVLTAAPGSGGPATGKPFTTTIRFVATAN